LHLAAQNGHLEVVQALLEKGAPVDALAKDNAAPLHLAAQNGHLEVVKELLEKGAPVDALAKDNWTPLHLAAFNGHLEVVQALLEKGAPVDALEIDNWTPLHRAALNGHLEVVKELLEKGAPVDAQSKGNWTPLQLAAQNGHLAVVKYLIKEGADIFTRNNHVTVLHRAISGNNIELIQFILDKINNATDKDLQRRYEVLNAPDGQGDTPLMGAIENERIKATQLLLEHNVDVNIKNNEGLTALHWAVKVERLELVQLLLDHHVDPAIKDKQGKTALVWVEEKEVPVTNAESINTINNIKALLMRVEHLDPLERLEAVRRSSADLDLLDPDCFQQHCEEPLLGTCEATQEEMSLQNQCQEAKQANTTSKPDLSLLKQAICSMPPTDQLSNISLYMRDIHNTDNTLVQSPDHGNPYRKCAVL
ncbi:MAG TPA: ankyrin repeat domain-containing protein, partial [Amoebophilaceae bacterium]|nr:ankyrin repeat domain-containing protein [Amoebophilaceae bacterium]